MTRRARILIATHVLAFAGAYGVAKIVVPPAWSLTDAAMPQPKTKSSHPRSG